MRNGFAAPLGLRPRKVARRPADPKRARVASVILASRVAAGFGRGDTDPMGCTLGVCDTPVCRRHSRASRQKRC